MNAVIYFGQPGSVTRTRQLLLERAGYKVVSAGSCEEAERAIERGLATVIVIGSAVESRRRAAIAQAACRHGLKVLSLHRGMRRRDEDVALDPYSDANKFLLRIGELLMRSHRHPDVRARYFLYVDRERRYVHASRAICNLLGYDARDLLGMKIDDLTYTGSADTAGLFSRYLRDGSQAGVYVLKDSNGRPLKMRYRARVLDDGCMVSELRPLSGIRKAA